MAKVSKDDGKSKSNIDQPPEAQLAGASATPGKVVVTEAGPADDVVWLPIDQIILGKRFRKEMGDMEGLKRSIKEHGLLSPIGVNKSDYTLIYGERRLKAMKDMGETLILVRLQDYDELDRLLVEYDENYLRKQFAPSEAVEAKRRIEPKLKEEARKRLTLPDFYQLSGSDGHHLDTNPDEWDGLT